MIVKINGKETTIPDNITVTELLSFLKIKQNYVAVELNKEIVKRSNWDSTNIKENDQIEIVTFVGGG